MVPTSVMITPVTDSLVVMMMVSSEWEVECRHNMDTTVVGEGCTEATVDVEANVVVVVVETVEACGVDVAELANMKCSSCDGPQPIKSSFIIAKHSSHTFILKSHCQRTAS